MRRTAMLVLLSVLSWPSFAAKQGTVQQLESVLSADSGKPDAEIARQLSEIELSERLSTDRLARLQAQAPGLKSRQALLVLADLSAFLALPAADIPARATPDLATQRQIMALAVDYVLKTIHQLPNLSTMRVTTSFQSMPWQPEKGRTEASSQEPLHFVGTYNASIFYRDGGEVVHAAAVQSGPAAQGLTTAGEFGPILNTALLDAARGKLAWSHWEQGAQGLEAVFHYIVPAEKSHYEVKYCCIWRQNGDRVYFQQFSGYQGDIAVDPLSGTILRLTLMADLKPTDPLVKAGILVEYGPVDIAGKTYICPTRSLALSVGLEIRDLQQGSVNSLGLLQTSLNDSVFEQYHVFRSEVRFVAADHGGTDTTAPATTDTTAPATQVADPATAETALAVSERPPPVAPPGNSPASAPPTLAVLPISAVPEISVEESAANPPAPFPSPLVARGPQTTLRVTTRLVDVGVMVSDKKGHPVTHLSAEDFEIYDNGRKQVTQLVNGATGAPAEKASVPNDHAADHPTFSNGNLNARAVNSYLTVLLVDPANLAWADLSRVRAEILRSLPTLPADEQIAVYITGPRGFQVLEASTKDHALVASRLREWMTNAQDLARAQQAEEHNRQHFDEVGHSSDLQYVNGNNSSSPESTNSVDPRLRDETVGSSREAQALSALIQLARSFGATPGHKNLIWVTGDNTLADWSDKAEGKDRESQHAGSLVLRAEQALNDAQISLYPLNASQIETQAVDASLQNKSVAVGPSATEAPAVQGGAEKTGRISAEMQQDLHPTGRAVQGIAEATGGRAVRRAADLAAELDSIIADGRAMYLLSFTPDSAPDDQYHRLTVKLTSRRGVSLRYRSGYQYAAKPATLKERFQKAVWQPTDMDELGLSVTPISSSAAGKLMLNIATGDVALKLQEERWRDKLDIFLIERNEDGVDAKITGQTMSLALKAATLDELTRKGIPFEQVVGSRTAADSVRVLVVDENSGLMGSVTVPANALAAKP